MNEKTNLLTLNKLRKQAERFAAGEYVPASLEALARWIGRMYVQFELRYSFQRKQLKQLQYRVMKLEQKEKEK